MPNCILCKRGKFMSWWDWDKELGLFGLCERCEDWVKGAYDGYLRRSMRGKYD